MRVVAGTAKGRRLQAPPGGGVRPTGDRVKEAVFDMLAARGAVGGASVVDLFAGSGALGIEALSQGAATATFVDRDAAALATVHTNLVVTGLYARGRVVQADALGWLAGAPPFDVALVDPPYGFEDWAVLFERLRAGLAVLESDRDLELPATWRVRKLKRYGGTVVTLAEPVGASDEKGVV